ncbi:MAG TPA: NIPSNAP family protein [Candidatus Binataceae bacterium]|nr:NIPSNAP family protein [Candidatus Binataceae bacterium]
MVYLQASIKLHPGKLQDFTKLINDLLPVVGKHGWKLVGSYAALVGRLNTVVDLWEIPNTEAVAAVLGDTEMQKHAHRIAEIVEDEVLTVLTKLPIG